VLIGCLPTAASPDTRKERLLELALSGDTSVFSTPVTVLENHPNCNKPGQVAFSVEIDARDLDFKVSGEGWNGSVWQFNRFDAFTQTDTCIVGESDSPSGFGLSRWDARPEDVCALDATRRQVTYELSAQLEPPLQCYRRERRGLELSIYEVRCPEQAQAHADVEDSLNETVRAAEIAVSISASATVCRTLTGTGLLDSSWEVHIEKKDGRDQFQGTFLPNRWVDDRADSPIEVRLVYDTRDDFLMNTTREIATGPFQLDPMRSGSLRLSFTLEEFSLLGPEHPPVTLQAGRSFRLDIQ